MTAAGPPERSEADAKYVSHGRAKARTPDDRASSFMAQERMILFWAAIGIDHTAVGIRSPAMQAMEVQGLIGARHRRCLRAHGTGRAVFAVLLEGLAPDFLRMSGSGDEADIAQATA